MVLSKIPDVFNTIKDVARDKSAEAEQIIATRKAQRENFSKIRKEKIKIAEEKRKALETSGDPFGGLQYIDFTKTHRDKAVEHAREVQNSDSEIPQTRNGTITIQHVPTGKTCVFVSYITSYSDTFGPKFSPEEVYGRMDPIYTYSGTSRSIQLGFNVVSASAREAVRNLQELQSLARFLYPTYQKLGKETGGNQATMIGASPLLRVAWSNWISNNMGQGLLVAPNNLSITPQFSKTGMIGFNQTTEGKASQSEGLLPLEIQVSMQFGVIHDYNLGYDEKGDNYNKEFSQFPYGLNDIGSTARQERAGNLKEDPVFALSSQRQFVLEREVEKEAKNRSHKSPGSRKRRSFANALLGLAGNEE